MERTDQVIGNKCNPLRLLRLRVLLPGLGIGSVIPLIFLLIWMDMGPTAGIAQCIELPKPTGPYAVGRELLGWTDQSRAETFARNQRRELRIWVWYPAASVSNLKNEYVPGRWGRSSARWEALDLRLRSGSIWSALFRSPISVRSIEDTQIHAVDNALVAKPPSHRPGGFPVLLFAPGLGNMPTDYSAVIEDIASHGYVVVGVNPTFFVPVTYFSNGNSVGMLRQLISPGDLNQCFPIWVADLRFVLHQIIRLPKTGIWKDIDTSVVGAFGHSYGGAAALSLCGSEDSVIAAVDWDGTPRGATAHKDLPKPTMLIQSNHGVNDGDRGTIRFYEMQERSTRVVINTALHRAFSDEVNFQLPPKLRNRLVGSIDGARMAEIVSAETRAFFDFYLRASRTSAFCDDGSLRSLYTTLRHPDVFKSRPMEFGQGTS